MRKLCEKIRGGNKKTKWWRVLKKQATMFCLETGLHGYKYIAQTHRSKTERIVWAIVVFSSLFCAIALMRIAWKYYVTHPTFTVIESTHHGTWNYPFPAVTICNINRISLNLTRNFVEGLKLPSDIRNEYSKEFIVQEMRLMNELLNPGVFEHDVSKNLTRLQSIISHNGLSIPEVIQLITQNCSSLLKACKWKAKSVQCNEMFKQSFSRDGLCCSFNYITSDIVNTGKSIEPERVIACGYQTGLIVMLNPEPEDYLATIFGSYGVKVMLHDPYDYPDYNAEYKLIGLNSFAFLSIAPEETYSKPGVKNLAISTRNCIFDDEDDQINFANRIKGNSSLSKYSYLNCMAGCRINVIKRMCGCIPYYFPQTGTRVCNLRDVGCLAKYKYLYETSWPGMNTDKNILKSKTSDIAERPCGCMPDCNLYRYFLEGSHGIFDENIYYSNLKFLRAPSHSKKMLNQSVVHIYFKDLVNIQYRRNVHYNWRNLFASFGGLLGLFAGFSLISIFELIYFFIIHVLVNIFTKKR